MAYRWKPSKTARREFAQKMQNDSDFAAEYEARKKAREDKRRSTSQFDYEKAGGEYVPTKEQRDFCFQNLHLFEKGTEFDAASMVMSGYDMNEKVHHDYIHIVNEKRRMCVRSF